jgi:hypothetical protein
MYARTCTCARLCTSPFGTNDASWPSCAEVRDAQSARSCAARVGLPLLNVFGCASHASADSVLQLPTPQSRALRGSVGAWPCEVVRVCAAVCWYILKLQRGYGATPWCSAVLRVQRSFLRASIVASQQLVRVVQDHLLRSEVRALHLLRSYGSLHVHTSCMHRYVAALV